MKILLNFVKNLIVFSFISYYTSKWKEFFGGKMMRNILVALLLMLIIGFAAVGVSKATDETEKVIEPTDSGVTIQTQS